MNDITFPPRGFSREEFERRTERAQTMMLAAQELGIDTCPQAAWIPFQKDVLNILGVPDDQELVTGMSLGYADPDKIENTLVSEREPVENVATFVGFG